MEQISLTPSFFMLFIFQTHQKAAKFFLQLGIISISRSKCIITLLAELPSVS